MNKTHNTMSAIQQGERDAKAQARAKRKGAAAAGGGKSKSGFSRKAGWAAVTQMQTRGRGIAIEALKNSKGAKGRIDYAIEQEKSAEIIYQNGDLAAFRACSKMRPDIK